MLKASCQCRESLLTGCSDVNLKPFTGRRNPFKNRRNARRRVGHLRHRHLDGRLPRAGQLDPLTPPPPPRGDILAK